MPTIAEWCVLALEHHVSGRLKEADQIYRQILAADPNHADALHLLGVVASQMGNHESAVQYIRQAIELNATESDFHGNLGNVFKAQGKLDVAVASYRRALELKPDDAGAHYNLGNAFRAQGSVVEAVACFRRALELNPEHAEAHNNLGNALKAQGKLDEAAACCRRALELKPDYAEAHNNLGNAFKAQGKLDEATESYRQALELKPELSEPHYNLGNVFLALGKLEEAVACFHRARVLKPYLPEAHNDLGNALQVQGKLDEAVASYRQALKLKPDYAEAHYNLGNAYQAQRQLNQAVASYRRALELKPDLAEPHNNLGNAFYDQGKLDEAVAAYCRALELKSDLPEAHNNLGTALQAQGKLEEAITCFRRALELKPNYAEGHYNLGKALNAQRKLDEAVACYRQALVLKPDYAEACSNLLLTLQYHAGASLSELAAAHAEYDRLQAAPLRTSWRPHQNDRDPERRLRIGFVSPDFGQHPVGYFLIRALEHFDRGQGEMVCYSDRIVQDELTKRFQAAATIWHEVCGWSDQELAEAIRADRIDILFDLAGHTAKNRLLVFARKPAPIQVTWAGYVGTTGLAAMDYILADRYEIPPGAEAHYRERVLRMPDGYVCYDPPAYAPGVSPLPALQQGSVTFGSFNNPPKINPPVVEVWAKILDRVPRSRLVLKYKGMNNASIANALANEFASHRIDLQRVECLGWSPHETLLAEYHRIDLALDPFPYNGGLTTCEALWMGVPVVTCPGETFASRHSLSHLSNVGLTETIARDLDDYVELAVSFASDLPRLAALRSGLRERMAASPLCDGKRFAENLMRVLREIWRNAC